MSPTLSLLLTTLGATTLISGIITLVIVFVRREATGCYCFVLRDEEGWYFVEPMRMDGALAYAHLYGYLLWMDEVQVYCDGQFVGVWKKAGGFRDGTGPV